MIRTIWLVAGVVCFAAFFSKGSVQAGDSLVGTWRLVGASSSTDKGDIIKEAYGPNPTGILTFTAEGRVMAIIAMGGRKPLSIPDRVSAPAEERADAFSTFIAYGGRYTFDGNKETVHIDVSSLQNWVGTDQVRFVTLHGDRVTLRTPPMARGGVLQTFELVWERVK